MVTHANVVRLFTETDRWFGFAPTDVWTLFHSCAFDFSVWELWGALLYGGRLVIVPFGISRDPDKFYQLLADEAVTVLNQTPTAFRQLMRAEEVVGPDPRLALRVVIFGGEALDMKTLKPWFDRHGDERPSLVNMYGITETTVHVTYRPLHQADLSSGSVIGTPIRDLDVRLVDEQQRPVIGGMAGEIWVSGAGLARGYLNRPELTSEKFVMHSFDSAPCRRWYRSGDLARRLPSGELEYLGRIDHQVKIRGFRIELGEIESALRQHPSVLDSVVVARTDSSGEKHLVAYLIPRAKKTIEPAVLRETLRARLPEYMVPSSFVGIEKLPLTTNGKLDLSALPAPEQAPSRSAKPESGLQAQIAAVWQEVLCRPIAGLDDNFFDLGGSSIHLAEIHARLQQVLKRSFPITDLFAHTTIRTLTVHLGTEPGRAQPLAAVRNRARRQREAAMAARKPLHQ
jgi:non-ribosomal peptide synthetase component F